MSVYDPYLGYGKNGEDGKLITPWSQFIGNHNFEYLVIDGIPISEWDGYEVKQNYYWAMGDNRDDSLDSRYWGLIPEDFILGEALFAYFLFKSSITCLISFLDGLSSSKRFAIPCKVRGSSDAIKAPSTINCKDTFFIIIFLPGDISLKNHHFVLYRSNFLLPFPK